MFLPFSILAMVEHTYIEFTNETAEVPPKEIFCINNEELNYYLFYFHISLYLIPFLFIFLELSLSLQLVGPADPNNSKSTTPPQGVSTHSFHLSNIHGQYDLPGCV